MENVKALITDTTSGRGELSSLISLLETYKDSKKIDFTNARTIY